MADNMCYVYIIECNNGNFYTGITNDFIRRWHEHFTGFGARYIKIYGFNKPVFIRVCKNKGEAMKLENSIKKLSKNEKILLIIREDKHLLLKAIALFKQKINI
jgi:putative endonuclease